MRERPDSAEMRTPLTAWSDQRGAPSPTRRERFLGTWTWLVIKNVIGWLLILAAFVAGPLVPGPGGIPLFLLGFALVTFPGKRRLTARVLRGKPVHVSRGRLILIAIGLGLVVAGPVLLVARNLPRHPAWLGVDALAHGPVVFAAIYLITFAVISVLVGLTPRALNVLLRGAAKARHKFRPWLRRHHVHLLPPRWRRRHPHEPGHGPLPLKDEILKFYRRRHRGHRPG